MLSCTRLVLRKATLPALFLLTAVLGCDGGTSPPQPESMSGSPSGTIAGTVAAPVSVSVTVLGDNGKPYPGGLVTFTVLTGGGTVSSSSATTGSSGQASTSWTLGQSAGSQQLRASMEGLSHTFQADARAGAPATLEAITTFPGTFQPGQALPQPAVFRVEDQFGNPVGGAQVAFAASSGGSVNPPSASSDSNGRASTTWTLGPGNGSQTLTATVATVGPVSVQASAYDPCLDVRTLSVGQTANGALSSASCELEVENQLRFLDQYRLRVTNAGAFQFVLESSFPTPALYILDPTLVASFYRPAGTRLSYEAFLDAGPGSGGKDYFGFVLSELGGGVGSYSLTVSASDGQLNACGDLWVASGPLSTGQVLAVGDCLLATGEYYDAIRIHLESGEGISVRQSSSAIDAYLLIADAATSATLAENDDFTGLDAGIDFVAPARGYYFVIATSFSPGEAGPYALTLVPAAGSAVPGPVGPPDEPDARESGALSPPDQRPGGFSKGRMARKGVG